MVRIEYLKGQRIGGCIFLEDVEPIYHGSKSRRRALFKCNCEKEFISVIDSVKRGVVKSCGCFNLSSITKLGHSRKTHGESKTPLYNCWTRMKQRCYNVSDKSYAEYGGRGIRVCSQWVNSFVAFKEDMGSSYSEGLELERIDVNKDYMPENCKWATEQEQAWNQRIYKNNKSGCAGVIVRPCANGALKYEVRISKDGKEHYLGTYYSITEAVQVRIEAEITLYGKEFKDKRN